jgi:hypothetical protein
MAYTIRGQAGKAMNATARSFETAKVIQDQLRMGSLTDDFFQYTVSAADAAGGGLSGAGVSALPEMGQTVELWKDSVRKFKGHVTEVRQQTKTIGVRVDGPWWWMRKINLSGTFAPPFDDAYGGGGSTDERHDYAFPQQGLATTLNTLLTRMIALGVPMAIGTIDSMFTCVPIHLPNMTCAEALVQVLRMCPDAIAQFDYTNSTPEINIRRRGTMSALTFDLGYDIFTELEIKPRADLELERVEVHYVSRNATTGKPFWSKQTAGGATTTKLQIMTASGPQLPAAILPKDGLEKVRIKSSGTLANSVIAKLDSNLAILAGEYGVFGGVTTSITGYVDAGNVRVQQTTNFPPVTFTDSSGTAVNTSGKYFLTSSEQLPEWAIKLLGGIQVTVAGTWVGQENRDTTLDWSVAFENWRAGAWKVGSPYFDSTGVTRKYWFARPFSVSTWMIDDLYSAFTTVYKPSDYAYANPPANLATNFLATQNWVPWEGRFTIVQDSLSLTNQLHRTFNINNCLPACASMDAMLSSVTYEILRGRVTYELGAPGRTSLAGAVNRIRQAPDGGIEWL